MRYLTRAWNNGDLTEDEEEALEAAFRRHRAIILPQLPESLRRFAETVDIHDGLLRTVVLDRGAGTLRMSLRCGEFDGGYYDVDLTYVEVRLAHLDVPVLRVIASDPESEALYLEEDALEPGWYVHRWLWWPFGRELDVHFSALAFERTPRPDREFDPPAVPFVESA